MTKTSRKHTIWSNLDLDVNDWKESYKEFVEANNSDVDPNNEDDIYSYMLETMDDYLIDARTNLYQRLSNLIIIIADLGRWNGRFHGYKVIKSCTISDCLYSDADYVEWYVDGRGNFRATEIHHDGTNYLLYRVFKDGISSKQMSNFFDKILEGTLTSADISRYTKSVGKYICSIYGF